MGNRHECIAPRRAWLIAAFASSAIASAAVAGIVGAQTSTIGRIWPIAEPDALAEIEAKVATLPRDMSKNFGPRSGWTALKARCTTASPCVFVMRMVARPWLTVICSVPSFSTG